MKSSVVEGSTFRIFCSARKTFSYSYYNNIEINKNINNNNYNNNKYNNDNIIIRRKIKKTIETFVSIKNIKV